MNCQYCDCGMEEHEETCSHCGAPAYEKKPEVKNTPEEFSPVGENKQEVLIHHHKIGYCYGCGAPLIRVVGGGYDARTGKPYHIIKCPNVNTITGLLRMHEWDLVDFDVD
jgi:hypothetical protein